MVKQEARTSGETPDALVSIPRAGASCQYWEFRSHFGREEKEGSAEESCEIRRKKDREESGPQKVIIAEVREWQLQSRQHLAGRGRSKDPSRREAPAAASEGIHVLFEAKTRPRADSAS